MFNITSVLAVRIRHIPDWELDTQPQMNRDLLTTSHYLSSEADVAELKRAVSYIMNFLVQEFPALSDLKKLLPEKPETVIGWEIHRWDNWHSVTASWGCPSEWSGSGKEEIRWSGSLSLSSSNIYIMSKTCTCHSTCITGCNRWCKNI